MWSSPTSIEDIIVSYKDLYTHLIKLDQNKAKVYISTLIMTINKTVI